MKKIKLNKYKYNNCFRQKKYLLLFIMMFISIGYGTLFKNLYIGGKVVFRKNIVEKSLYDEIVNQNKENDTMVLDNESSNYVSASTGINFGVAPSDTNGKGLYVRSGTESDTYPIYYYRGDVKNNNVIFGGFCWKIVRTTETGGVKLVYNGVPTEGKCNNTGTASQLSTISEFNVTSDSQNAAYVGYMYGNPSGATYSDIHTNTKASTSSTIKKVIDTWYSQNMTGYTSYLEDTVWCNDRSLYSGTGVGTTTTEYGGYGRLYGNSPAPSLICANKNDKFTVSDIDNGNGALIYPVALLTADELTLAGNGYTGYSSSTYLWTGEDYWTMTPSNSFALALEMYIDSDGKLDDVTSVATTFGVRPALSIKYGARVEEGNGTSDSPFIIIAEETNYLYDEIVLQNLENGVSVFDNTSSTYVSASTGISFTSSPGTTNGQGVYVRNGTESDKYPVYYYRGAVTNNNVIFAGFCWKIVRTTDTGGIKLIYNGEPTDGTCNNTGTASQIQNVAFNSTKTDNAYIGYMYGGVSQSSYDATHASTKTSTSSTIKNTIDNWYVQNISKYESYLEDTVWCNDRTFNSGTGVGTSLTYYSAYARTVTTPNPTLECPNQNDRFTVNETLDGRDVGNGALTYPIALLTADELTLAGNGYKGYSKTSFLYSGQSYWLLSPIYYYSGAYMFRFNTNGNISAGATDLTDVGLRPAISLNHNIRISSGDGSTGLPFVVQ